MKSKLTALAAAVSIAGFALTAGVSTGVQAATQDAVNAAAEAASPMSVDEVFGLYANKSWIWSDGAGYFANSKRAFTAYSGSGRNASYGEGNWFIKSNGSLCFRATWYAADGSAPAVTCFDHRKNGNTIYQRKAPGGDWYAFQSTPARRSNEIRKLRSGDYVSSRLNRIKSQLSPSA
ncbi:DUF995 domain-containing protein [Roseibium sp. MMSF_3544]|uniref:DUF995 domain-containing protein n=1 Tax=unclassified Roseibium TaxID=2629323 RepID=UPI00273E0547|nr:DUF995 domain-containing protein [Roseibium sp. MMSF_3544]